MPVGQTDASALVPFVPVDSVYQTKEGNYLFVVEEKKESWEYFSFDKLFQEQRAYKIVFCLQDGSSFLGVRTCYRYSKNDKK